MQRVFSCAVVDAIDLKKYIVVNGFVIAVCDQLQSLQQCPAHQGLDQSMRKLCIFGAKPKELLTLPTLRTLLTLHPPLNCLHCLNSFGTKRLLCVYVMWLYYFMGF